MIRNDDIIIFFVPGFVYIFTEVEKLLWLEMIIALLVRFFHARYNNTIFYNACYRQKK